MSDISSSQPTAVRDVVICECFARDGLQHEHTFLPTDRKIELIDQFSRIGFPRIEATSLAHPKYVPQFSDAEDVLARIMRRKESRYKATCANLKAVERAKKARTAGFGPDEISLIASATDSHSLKNLNRTRAEQWKNIESMVVAAGDDFTLVGALSVVLGCPFEGGVDPQTIVDDALRLQDLGASYVTLGDTAGLGNPRSVKHLMDTLLDKVPGLTFVAHFHNTRGTGLANCVAALDCGITHFDSSFGGVGGHPAQIIYGDGITGNVSTEDLVVMFESMGVKTGLNLPALMETARLCEHMLGRELAGMVTRSSFDGMEAKTFLHASTVKTTEE